MHCVSIVVITDWGQIRVFRICRILNELRCSSFFVQVRVHEAHPGLDIAVQEAECPLNLLDLPLDDFLLCKLVLFPLSPLIWGGEDPLEEFFCYFKVVCIFLDQREHGRVGYFGLAKVQYYFFTEAGQYPGCLAALHEADNGPVLEDNPNSFIAISSEFGKPGYFHFLEDLVLHGGHQTCLGKFIFKRLNLCGIVRSTFKMRLIDEDISWNEELL
jgi:hypothetical protein